MLLIIYIKTLNLKIEEFDAVWIPATELMMGPHRRNPIIPATSGNIPPGKA